jgi:hypothetical protein
MKIFMESKREVIDARALAFWEITSVVVSCWIAEWVILSFFGRSRSLIIIPVLLALGLTLLSHRAYGETLRDLGFRVDNFVASVRWLALPTLLAVVVILIGGWLLRGGHLAPSQLRARLIWLPFWALLQQYVLQCYLNRRAQIVVGPGWHSVVVVGVVFSLVHLPNLLLAGLTLVGGMVWAAAYQSQPNIFALAISHSIASICVAWAIPLEFTNGLRVGFKFFG